MIGGRLYRLAWLALLAAVPAAAQERAQADLTDPAIEQAIAFFNRPGTIRIVGDSRVAAGSELVGDVAVLEGVLHVDGRIRGNLLVINGELHLGAGAAVEGTIDLIGAALFGGDSATIGGALTIYRGSFSYQLEDERLSRIRPQPVAELAAGRAFDFGRTDVIASAGHGYNRAEGLPIQFGPRLTLGHSNPTVLEGMGIYRTASGLLPDEGQLGYTARVEQYLGGHRAARIGVRLYSEIVPIESSGLSDPESSFAAFVLHEDYRDHYERTGWAGYLRLGYPGRTGALALEFRDEEHAPVAARPAWSIWRSREPWRLEPLAARGRLRSFSAELAIDSRNQSADPSAGWLVRLQTEAGLSGALRYVHDTSDQPAPTQFTAGLADVRRYARLGPGSTLAVRAFVAGSLNAAALPVQRQHALGGDGTLPGFLHRQFDCSSQITQFTYRGNSFEPSYGCDRVVLVQVEHQGEFGFFRRFQGSDDLGLLQRVRWVAFFDAGRAWTEGDARGIRGRGGNDFSADAGLGVKLGPVGLYWAAPLSGSSKGINFFIRLGNRI